MFQFDTMSRIVDSFEVAVLHSLEFFKHLDKALKVLLIFFGDVHAFLSVLFRRVLISIFILSLSDRI